MHFCYLFHGNSNGFPYLGSRHCFCSSLHDLFWRDDDLILDWTNGHNPMATVGGWLDGLVKCDGRHRSDYGQLHDSCYHDHDLLPRSGDKRSLYIYFFHSNGNSFPYRSSRHRYDSSFIGMLRRDDDLILDWTNGHDPMGTVGGWGYRLGECIWRFRSDYGQLHHTCSHEHELLPRSGD
jgi:hypothetical protein